MTADESQLTEMFERIPGLRAASPRRLAACSLPVLVLLALAAALLWLLPVDPALAQDDAKGPKITAAPAIDSSPQSGGVYRAGETIIVTLTFSQPVEVTGKPRLRLKIGDKKRWARYDSTGAAGVTLSFTHRVKDNDADADGISIGKNQLKLNGGTIADVDGNAARLKHPKLADQAGHQVNGAPDEPGPPEPEPTPTATPTPTPEPQPPANNEPQFTDDTAARSVDENTAAGENVGAAVTATDDDNDALTYALTGADAGSFDFDTSSGQITVKDVLDYETRASYSVTVTVHDGKDTAGEADASEDASIAVTVTVRNVDEPGTVILDTDAPQSGSAVSAIVFDPDGSVTGETWAWESSADASAWTAIAGATADAYTPTNDDANKYLRATASYDDRQGSGKSARAASAGTVTAAVIATSADPPPSITDGPITNSPARGDTYGAGEEISVQLTFSEPVTVSGTPRLGIDIGDNRRWAEYEESAAGDTSLLFSYTVQADDRDADGLSIAANALELNGGSIEDGDGNAADLAHPAWAASSNHKVEGSPQPIAGEPQQDTAAAAPTGIQAIGGLGDYSVSLSWTNPSDSSITKYQYRYKKVADDASTGEATADALNAADYTPWVDMAGSGSATIRHRVCLPNGSKYKFEVRAVNATGAGPAAAYITAKVEKGTDAAMRKAAVIAALTSPPQVLTVTTDDTRIIPTPYDGSSLRLGDRFRILFITDNEKPAAASSDIAHYNSCAALAARRSSGWHAEDRYLQFRALVSTATVDARGNTGTAPANGSSYVKGEGEPIYWIYFGWGLKVADDYEDFYDGDWDSVNGTNLSQVLYSPPQIWTGSSADGTKAGANGANAAGGSQVAYGTLENRVIEDPDFRTETLYKGLAASATELPIYILSPVITIGAPPATEKPAKPFNLKGRPGDGEVTLSWDDPQNSSITRYQYAVVKRTWNAGSRSWSGTEPSSLTYTDITGSDADTTSYTVTGLENHAYYYFYLRAVNGVGESLPSGLGRVPHAQSSGFTSRPQDGDTYKNGEVITVRINFLFPLFFAGGPPTLPIMIGTEERLAECAGLSSTVMQGSVALVCKYTVQTGDVDTDGIGVEADKLKLNGSFKTVPSPSSSTHTAIGHSAYSPASVQKVDGSQTPPPEPQTVPASWELLPSGVSVGDQLRLLFVTSTVGYALPTSDIAASNKIVRDLATATVSMLDDDGNNFGSQFRALISTQSVDARDNTVTTGTGVPIYWVKGVKVADHYGDFYDGSWDSTAWQTENADQTVSGGTFAREVWTGSQANGTKHASNYAGGSSVQYGWLGGNTISSNTSGLRTGGNGFAYYGLSPVLTVVPPLIPAQPTGFTATPGNMQVTLRWEDPGDSRITKWQYRYKKGSGNYKKGIVDNYGDWADVPNSDDTTTSHAVTGLTNGTTYTFQVRAAIGDTAGPASEQSARPSPSVWSATLKVDQETDGKGCSNLTQSSLDDCSDTTVLSEDEFSYGGTDYTIAQVTLGSDNNLLLTFTSSQSGSATRTALGSLTLHADGRQFRVSSAGASPSAPRISWRANLGWTDGQTVQLSLREDPQITDIRLKDNDNRFGVPINLINRGFQLIIEVEYDRELDYSSLPQAFPLMLGSFGGSANSEEELRKMGYKGEPSKTDTNTGYAELVPDRESRCCNTESGEVVDDSKCRCKSNHQALCVDQDNPANPQTNCACWYHHWEMKPLTEGKVITYKYTVRWGDLDDDGVSIVRPDTGAVMTFPQKVNGRH